MEGDGLSEIYVVLFTVEVSFVVQQGRFNWSGWNGWAAWVGRPPLAAHLHTLSCASHGISETIPYAG